MLARLGNKRKIAKKIMPHFPKHDLYIEPFFGGGGMFFSKPLAMYNIMNDLDSDVYNLYNILKTRKDDFIEEFRQTPYHNDLFQYWLKNVETDDIMKAVRFVYLSNYSFLGKKRSTNTPLVRQLTISFYL
jgi:DNA adenine methylase